MVNLHFLLGAAMLAGVSKEPLQQLGPPIPDKARSIIEDCFALVSQRDAAPLGYQRTSSFTLDLNLESLARAVRCMDGRGVPVPDLLDGGAPLGGQRLGEGLLHDPPHTVEAVKVVGHSVILHETPIFRLELLHDA